MAPDVTVASAAAPPQALRLTLWLLLVALVIVGSSLHGLLRVFKGRPAPGQARAADRTPGVSEDSAP